MSGEIPLQIDLFSGELVDTRTRPQKLADSQREQPQQNELFTQREIAQFGVRARPQMSLSPHTKLVLIREDPRTDEEIEADLLRQAQELTQPLFAPSPTEAVVEHAVPTITQLISASHQNEPEPEGNDDDDEEDDEPTVSTLPPLSKYDAYLALVKAAEERAMTIFNTPTSALSESMTMNIAKLNGRLAGLSGTEISTALTIGDFRGKQLVRQNEHREGLRPPETKPVDEEIPIIWTSRADMLMRRPDLKDKILALSEDEIADLGWFVGEGLQEMYWMMLNFVLSLHLDHELRLMRTVSKNSRG